MPDNSFSLPLRAAATRRRNDRLLATSSAAAIVFALAAFAASPVRSQEAEPVIFPGAMAVTAFPGTEIPGFENGLPPGVDPLDETFIARGEPSLRIFDVRALGGPAKGQLVTPPEPFAVKNSQIGLVFGLAYDDGIRDGIDTGIPHLYAAQSSLFGMHIVTPDEDADGRPERQRKGAAGAAFMDGQFGIDLGGKPGSIYKIDGVTGAPSLFATIDTNSGPGIGNIAFDKPHRQFFASDLDNGLIHRISIDGALIDTFDHGVAGRPAHALPPVADDGSVMDIGSAGFDAEDPESWAYTQDERRVWGVAVHGGRLWYAVGDTSEIWSVGINRDSTFGADPRWELTVEADRDLAVTDIVFDNRGFMYLAQRGERENRYDYSRYANTGKGEVMRYHRENPDDPATESVWVQPPGEYAVGFPDGSRQTDGGIDLQYGYDQHGYINQAACTDTIVKTGDDLRNNPALLAELEPGGPLNVHGVQLTPLSLIKPANLPPFGSWFVDQDGLFEDPELKGHIGDVEVFRPCPGSMGYYEPYYPDVPPGIPPEGQPPCVDVIDLQFFCTPGGLEADLYLQDKTGYGFDSAKTNSKTPGTSVSPLMQTLPAAGAPYTLGIFGHYPGQRVDVGFCLYKDADAKAGGLFPCCKVTVPLDTPDISCEP